ncbi:MAG: hypothetical protein AVDCRST_MAG54-4559 [uncultured Actinomycetospora sp.]|uniref:Uncharacterized protein n=1 Tax=uncultured Actinomycetospora sp. TaxID=1135996 RepID=A0A6J4K0G3_9PSEU|nr:MAG: hypothetical protein AVDCRST_MAG54-4559 [uncultured Actinomycetospora sp.]
MHVLHRTGPVEHDTVGDARRAGVGDGDLGGRHPDQRPAAREQQVRGDDAGDEDDRDAADEPADPAPLRRGRRCPVAGVGQRAGRRLTGRPVARGAVRGLTVGSRARRVPRRVTGSVRRRRARGGGLTEHRGALGGLGDLAHDGRGARRRVVGGGTGGRGVGAHGGLPGGGDEGRADQIARRRVITISAGDLLVHSFSPEGVSLRE